MLLLLLGLFSGIGYNINSICESFSPSSDRTYVDVSASFDATYNPILCPFYWLTGMGHLSENITSIFPLREGSSRLPGYRPPTHHQTLPFGRGFTQQERFDSYTMSMAIRGMYGNLAILLLVAVIIEAAKQRLLYIVLFSGVIGFLAGGVVGTFIGLLLSSIALAIYKLKFANDYPIQPFWHNAQ